jgi:hypothetical protein
LPLLVFNDLGFMHAKHPQCQCFLCVVFIHHTTVIARDKPPPHNNR